MAFKFKLARELGMTVADMCSRMTVAEYVHWGAHFGIEAKEIKSRG